MKEFIGREVTIMGQTSPDGAGCDENRAVGSAKGQVGVLVSVEHDHAQVATLGCGHPSFIRVKKQHVFGGGRGIPGTSAIGQQGLYSPPSPVHSSVPTVANPSLMTGPHWMATLLLDAARAQGYRCIAVTTSDCFLPATERSKRAWVDLPPIYRSEAEGPVVRIRYKSRNGNTRGRWVPLVGLDPWPPQNKVEDGVLILVGEHRGKVFKVHDTKKKLHKFSIDAGPEGAPQILDFPWSKSQPIATVVAWDYPTAELRNITFFENG